MEKGLLLAYLEGRHRPIGDDPRGGELHRTILAEAPELYLDLLADTAADVSQRREVLANLLGQPVAARISRAAIPERLRTQPVEEALQVLEAVRRGRCNGRWARSLGLAFLLGHERLAELAATRRTRLVRLLKHLLGERTWTSVVRYLRTGALSDPAAPKQFSLIPIALVARMLGRKEPENQKTAQAESFVRRTVLRHAKDPMAAREALRVLAGDVFEAVDPTLANRLAARRHLEQGAGLPRATLFGLRGTFHPNVPAGRVRCLSAAVAAEDVVPRDGPLTTQFKQALKPMAEPPTREVVSERLAEAATVFPAIDATLGVVLDLSGSAASSGERADHPAALGLALTALLRDRVREVRLHQVGGSGRLNGLMFARPEGATDLATAVLAAARERPEVILVFTDGYENVRQGDTAVVVEGLRRLELGLPVLQVVPLFAAGEDLTRRRLGEGIPVLTVRSEQEIGELLARVLLAHAPATLGHDDIRRLHHLLIRFGGES
jgi:hypothetical protein